MSRLKDLLTFDKTTLGASAFVLLTALALSTVYYLSATENDLLDLRRQAFGTPTQGYSSTINANYYGLEPRGLDDLQRAAAAPSGEENELTVQDVQPPSISGFSTDQFTGNVTVNFPISAPPGRGGLTPQLALSYSSGSVYDSLYGADYAGPEGRPRDLPDGQHSEADVERWKNNTLAQGSQIGFGWTLSGLGKVFRDSQGSYSLILGGKSYRLHKKEESENLWRTEPGSFLKIEHRVIANEEPGGEGQQADKWVVYDTDGTKYEFSPRGFIWKRCEERGAEGQCIQGAVGEAWAASWNNWPLNKVIDTYSNQIDIPYQEERKTLSCGPVQTRSYPASIYPYQILYSGSGNDESGFLSRLWFEYQGRDDTEVIDKDNGCAQVFWSNKRLAAIEAQVKDTAGQWRTVRRHVLDNGSYFTAESDSSKNVHLKLGSITTVGRDGTTLPPYSFSYYESGPGSGAGFVLNSYRLLKTADSGYGGRIGYQYEQYQTPVFLNRANDFGGYKGEIKETHRVKTKIVDDGLGKTYTTIFSYDAPRGLVANQQLTGFEFVGHHQVQSQLENINRGTSEFVQGQVQDGRFYPSPARGRLIKNNLTDLKQDKVLTESESLYQIVPEITDWTNWQQVWETSHFVSQSQSRSCQDPQSSTPLGGLTAYRYEEADQNGQQFGNLTHSTEYMVNGCDFDSAQAYRQSHQTYFPNLDSWITSKVAGQEVYACNSNLSGTGSVADCPNAKRLSLSWNIYDGDHTKVPWHPPGNKGELKLNRKFVNFPERVFGDASEFIQQATWQTVDSEIGYDEVGNVTSTSTFADYGIVQNQSSDSFAWAFSQPGNGSERRTSETGFDPYYKSVAVQTKNPLGQRTVTVYSSVHPSLSDRVFVQDENDIKNSVGRVTITDGLSRPVKIFSQNERDVSGDQPVKIIEYASGAPYYVYTRTRDDAAGGSEATYLHSWRFYNGLGQPIQTQSERMGDSAQIYITDTEYNAQGLVSQASFPRESTRGGILQPQNFDRWSQKTTYDALGRVLNSQLPDNPDGKSRSASTVYEGRVTATTNAKGNRKISEADGFSRLVRATDPKATTRYEYDHFDRLIKTINNRGNESKVFYNNFGQKIKIDDPDLGQWSYEYYPTGELKKIIDAKNQVRTFDYDVLGRMAHKYWGELGQNLVATNVYDDPNVNGVGRRAKLIDDQAAFNGYTGSTSFTYDIKGRLTSEQKVINFEDQAYDYTTAFEYDRADRIKEIRYPGSDEVVEQTYDEAGRLVSVKGNTDYLKQVSYNELSLPVSEVLGNQTVNEYAYEDQTKRLNTITIKNPSGQSLLSFDYDYDPVDNITSIDHSGSQTSERALNFVYDELDRLTGFGTTGASVPDQDNISGEYQYDELGRMTLKREEVAGVAATPLTLDYFKARAAGDHMIVSWKASGEPDYVFYRLERKSPDQADYQIVLDNIQGGGGVSAPYDFPDEGQRAGFGNCYRLTAVYQDGTTQGFAPIVAGDTGSEPDGKIDLFDLVRIARVWGTNEGDADFNADVDLVVNGVIDLFDLVWAARSWGMSCQ